ncbi:MAG TPA: S-adenosylmethionine decarboxylase [Flavisolibacter sp.]|jgi:S-adenosylmethionine decarboxylase|nr:S-adenosylmethionine decarboxylase [Flavisolibacter sp.]
MTYNPGTHLIATLTTSNSASLHQFGAFQRLVDSLIAQNHLQKLGEVYHNFLPSGYTAVVCLSESHLSIHTWPEYGKINVDIYLSNFQRNNDGTVQRIYEAMQQHFEATVENEQFLRR